LPSTSAILTLFGGVPITLRIGVTPAQLFLSVSGSSPAFRYDRKSPCLTLRAAFWFFAHARAFRFFVLVLYVDGSEKPSKGERPRPDHETIKVRHFDASPLPAIGTAMNHNDRYLALAALLNRERAVRSLDSVLMRNNVFPLLIVYNRHLALHGLAVRAPMRR
jgi:hypothetical protein